MNGSARPDKNKVFLFLLKESRRKTTNKYLIFTESLQNKVNLNNNMLSIFM